MNFKSLEEEYFSYYLEELEENGFILSWNYESSTFKLSDKFEFNNKTISEAKSITSDFSIKWNPVNNPFIFNCESELPKAKKGIKQNIFIVYSTDCLNNTLSYIEVKSPFEKSVTSSFSFPYKQSWLLQSQNILIQKIIPRGKHLFHYTFTPKKVQDLEVYKIKSKAGESKIKWNVRNLTEYLKLIKYDSTN